MLSAGCLAGLLATACGNGNTGIPDVEDGVGDSLDDLPDVSTDGNADGVEPDIFVDSGIDAPDEAADTESEDALDGEGPDSGDDKPVSHTFVHEMRTRDLCIPDGPWTVDRVRQFRDSTSGLASFDISAVSVGGGRVWVGTGEQVYVASVGDVAGTGVFTAAGTTADGVTALAAVDDGVLIASGSRVLKVTVGQTGDAATEELASFQAAVSDVAWCGNSTVAVTGGIPYRLGAEGSVPIALPEGVVSVNDITCAYDETWIAADNGVWLHSGGVWTREWAPGTPVLAVSTLLYGSPVAAVTSDSLGVIVVGADPTVIVPGPGGLPAGNLTGVAMTENTDDIAVAHDIGVSTININRYLRSDPAVAQHFHSMRWIPSETVTDIAIVPDSSNLLVATPAGLSFIYREDTTLEQKAERMFADLDRWFWRLDGFVTANASFVDAFSDERLPLWDDDNDGQWTQEAVGAFCYAYRVTADERYYQAARRAITNMGLQIDIPAQDFVNAGLGRGFITRSFVRDDEGDVFTSKATQSNWHLVDFIDGHQYYWKDDTSSDEVDGHLYGFSIYYDLCAKDDAERAWVAGYLTDLVGYMVDHGYMLLDLDGQPTEHAQYAPEVLAIAVDGLEACTAEHDILDCIDAWGGGAFLNSLQILGGLLAAWHVSGEQRFYDAYESLITEYRYDELAIFNENVATWTSTAIANYCDHELADLAFLTLIRYEPNPVRRQMWIDSMLAAWQYEIGERNPLKSLSMAAAVNDVPGLAAGVSTLVDFPEDQRQYLVDNSHRKDVSYGGKDRFERPQFKTVLPYDEIHSVRWDTNPYRIVDGGSPSVRRAPTFWLLPYWGLRYYNAIGESCAARAE